MPAFMPIVQNDVCSSGDGPSQIKDDKDASIIIPANVGIQSGKAITDHPTVVIETSWTPAFAEMTEQFQCAFSNK